MESKIGFRVLVRHPLMAWMVRHAGSLITWCVKGPDGCAAYERARHKPFRTKLMAFGEVCRYKNRSHEPLSNAADGKIFHLGIFVGIDQRTG